MIYTQVPTQSKTIPARNRTGFPFPSACYRKRQLASPLIPSSLSRSALVPPPYVNILVPPLRTSHWRRVPQSCAPIGCSRRRSSDAGSFLGCILTALQATGWFLAVQHHTEALIFTRNVRYPVSLACRGYFSEFYDVTECTFKPVLVGMELNMGATPTIFLFFRTVRLQLLFSLLFLAVKLIPLTARNVKPVVKRNYRFFFR